MLEEAQPVPEPWQPQGAGEPQPLLLSELFIQQCHSWKRSWCAIQECFNHLLGRVLCFHLCALFNSGIGACRNFCASPGFGHNFQGVILVTWLCQNCPGATTALCHHRQELSGSGVGFARAAQALFTTRALRQIKHKNRFFCSFILTKTLKKSDRVQGGVQQHRAGGTAPRRG